MNDGYSSICEGFFFLPCSCLVSLAYENLNSKLAEWDRTVTCNLRLRRGTGFHTMLGFHSAVEFTSNLFPLYLALNDNKNNSWRNSFGSKVI